MAIDKDHPKDTGIVNHPLADRMAPPMSTNPTRAPEGPNFSAIPGSPADLAERRNEQRLMEMLQPTEAQIAHDNEVAEMQAYAAKALVEPKPKQRKLAKTRGNIEHDK